MAIKYDYTHSADKQCISFDETVFEEKNVQRVFQYLRRFDCDLSLDKFESKKIEGRPEECLSHIFKLAMKLAITDPFMTILLLVWFNRNMSPEADLNFDPSWSEVHNFITFLDTQLHDCEESAYGQLASELSAFRGFKHFIVRFSIVMAKVRVFQYSLHALIHCLSICSKF